MLADSKWQPSIPETKNSSYLKMGVSKNNGTPKSSIPIGFSIINQKMEGLEDDLTASFWGVDPGLFCRKELIAFGGSVSIHAFTEKN